MPEMGKKLSSQHTWARIFDDKSFTSDFEEFILPGYIQSCRWFAGKSSTIQRIHIQTVLPMVAGQHVFFILILEVQFKESFSHQYLLPIGFIFDKGAIQRIESTAICRLLVIKTEGYIFDALQVAAFRDLIFKYILESKSLQTHTGVVKFEKADSFIHKPVKKIPSQILKAEQSNTAIIYNDRYFFKWFRRVFPESNPDLEISRYLNQNHFKHTAEYLGSISWNRMHKPPISLGLLQQKLTNDGDAWKWMLNEVNRFFNLLDKDPASFINYQPNERLFEPIKPKSLASELIELMSPRLVEAIVLIGKRTAQMHLALVNDHSQTDFKPIPFNSDYSVWLKNKVTLLFDQRIGLLEKNIKKLKGLAKEYGQTFLDRRNEVLEEILGFDESKLCSMRTRVHGDYHLGQVLMHDMDFYILDFEGEPESTIRDRKVKQSPLKDVAGMLRSFHYAIYATLFDESKKWTLSRTNQFEMAERFYQLVCGLYMHGFIKTAIKGGLDIGYKPEIHYLLRYHVLEKAVYELGYELNSRPAWAIIPLRGIMKIIG